MENLSKINLKVAIISLFVCLLGFAKGYSGESGAILRSALEQSGYSGTREESLNFLNKVGHFYELKQTFWSCDEFLSDSDDREIRRIFSAVLCLEKERCSKSCFGHKAEIVHEACFREAVSEIVLGRNEVGYGLYFKSFVAPDSFRKADQKLFAELKKQIFVFIRKHEHEIRWVLDNGKEICKERLEAGLEMMSYHR